MMHLTEDDKKIIKQVLDIKDYDSDTFDPKILDEQYTERHMDDFHTMYIGEILDIRAR